MVGERLPFKRDSKVSVWFSLYQPLKPEQHIQDIERNDPQFSLLGQMYLLVIVDFFVIFEFRHYERKRPKGDAPVSCAHPASKSCVYNHSSTPWGHHHTLVLSFLINIPVIRVDRMMLTTEDRPLAMREWNRITMAPILFG